MSDRDAGNVGERVLFDAFKAFADGPALRAFLPAMMLPWLEGQRALLRWYQKVVDEEGSTHAAEEHFRSLARSFLAAYLEFAQKQRHHHSAMVQAQSEFLKSYLALVDEFLADRDDETPRSGQSG